MIHWNYQKNLQYNWALDILLVKKDFDIEGELVYSNWLNDLEDRDGKIW